MLKMNVEKINCEYCNKEIIKYQKKRHQNSVKCKKIQIELNLTPLSIDYKCKYCNKILNQNEHKISHEKICNAKDIYYEFIKHKEKYEDLINHKNELLKQKDNEIIYLKKLLNKQGNTTINNTTNNTTNNIQQNVYININHPNDILSVIDKLDKQHMIKGGKGFGEFLMKFVLKDKIYINDISRKIISYKLNDEIIKDDGYKIIPKMIKIYEEKTGELLKYGPFESKEERDIISNNNLDAYDTIFAIENKNRNPKETIMYKDILYTLLNNAIQKNNKI